MCFPTLTPLRSAYPARAATSTRQATAATVAHEALLGCWALASMFWTGGTVAGIVVVAVVATVVTMVVATVVDGAVGLVLLVVVLVWFVAGADAGWPYTLKTAVWPIGR